MASTADLEAEILAELEENQDAYVTPVNDVITIDPETRTIHLPESEMLFGVEEEKDVERKFFKCPRIVGDNIDLFTHQIYISYMAVKDKNATFIHDSIPQSYWCDDVALDETGNYITFSWLLSGNILASRGFVGFAVIAKSLEGEMLKTRWKTAPAVGTVLMTIPDGGEEIADLYPDIISQIIAKIEKIESGSISDEVVATAVEKYMEVHPFEEAGTAESKVSEHNVALDAHNDIRLLVQGLTERLNALADSDDTTLDQMSEVVAYIKSNKSLIDAITTSKVNVSDIIDNLTTNVNNKPLSAAQGVALKALIDGITIPEKLPNPQKLTFSGAVTAEYDGSEPLTVEIPSGGDGSIGHNITITELASGMIPYGTEPVFTHTGITFGQLNDYKRIAILIMNGSLSSGADWVITHNEDNTLWKMINLTSQRGYIELRKVASHIWDVLFKTNTNVSSGFSSSPYAPNLTGNSGYIAGTFMLNFANTQNDEICIYNKSTTSADVNWVIQGMNF